MRIAVVEIRDHHALSLGIQRHMDPTPLMTPYSLSTESLTTNRVGETLFIRFVE